MTKYILAIDQGTTSSRGIVFNTLGQIQGVGQQEFSQHFPADGWVEHNPEDIWESTLTSCKKAIALAGITAKDIATIGITNQRETTLVWDKTTGTPIYNAIVWQDRRTADYCAELKHKGLEPWVQAKTGLLLDPYFSATKLRWILNNVKGARSRAEKGELAFGTVDTFLLWRLTDGACHKTDATNASRTLLFNIHQQCWDEELLKQFDIPAAMLPEVEDCSANFGYTNLFGSPITIAAMVGDQQAALVGQACFQPGMAKSTYGTGCFLMLNTGLTPVKSSNKLLTTIGYRLHGEVSYAIEGSIFIAGAAIQWLRDGLKLIANAEESEQLALQAGTDHGVYLVPAFTGLGAPYWNPDARGALFGLTRDTGRAEIAAAALQSVCYQTRDLVNAMVQDGAEKSSNLRIDGGMANNNWMMQFLADTLQARIERPAITETTALGAAYLAGLHVGIYASLDEISTLWQQEKTFTPSMSQQQADKLYKGWNNAVQRVLNV